MTQAYSNKALPPGTVLREWRLEQVLGVGGFGIVYKGRGLYFDELVAIKEYFPSAISDRRDGDTVVPNDSESEEIHALGLKKFVEEAKLLWNLSKPTRHPNIVSVRSLFEIHGTAYIVMDFEDGTSLSQLLKAGKRFTEETLSPLIFPIAEGLDRAHRVGVVHRDIKPANILVSADGRPVLIDFGSARFDSGQATSTKVTFHTPPYAAIEQYVKTYEQGPWTDIYALGVALYECVAGEKPPEVLERLHGGLGEPLAGSDRPGYSQAFLRAIDAAMIIRPGDRPQSIPQWLAMFDPDNVTASALMVEDAPTRFAAFQSPPDEIVPVLDPLEAEEKQTGDKAVDPTKPEDSAQPIAAKTAEKAKKAEKAATGTPVPKLSGRIRPLPVAIATVAALILAVAGWLYWPQGRAPGEPVLASNEITPVATVTNTADPGFVTGLSAGMDMLIADARKARRPIGQLTNAKSRLDALAAEVAGLANQPDSAATTQARIDEMKALTMTASSDFAGAIAGDADRQSRQLARSVPPADPAGSAAAQKAAADIRAATATMAQARARINAAASAARSAPDPNQALAAAREGAVAYGPFAAAYAKAQGSALAIRTEVNVLPLRRAEFTAVDASARAIYAQIAEMGRGNRPGLFASGERRDGWRTRQDNATKAKTSLAELDQLVRSMRDATTVTEAESLLAQVRTVKNNLAGLQSSSTAAMPRKE